MHILIILVLVLCVILQGLGMSVTTVAWGASVVFGPGISGE